MNTSKLHKVLYFIHRLLFLPRSFSNCLINVKRDAKMLKSGGLHAFPFSGQGPHHCRFLHGRFARLFALYNPLGKQPFYEKDWCSIGHEEEKINGKEAMT